MPVKSRSKTFKPGDKWDFAMDWLLEQTSDAVELSPYDDTLWFEKETTLKKRVTITITYERDDKTE